LKSDEIIKRRNELSTLMLEQQLADVKQSGKDNSDKEVFNEIKKSLKESIDTLYNINNSIEGIPGKNLLDQWLDLTIKVDAGKARLKSLDNSRKEFERSYELYAPMGSDLNKLERNVDIAEKEYLSLLHGLNQAKLRQQDLKVTQSISVVDPVEIPIVPNASKKNLLVVGAFLCCMLLSTGVIILREYLDNSIASPSRLRSLTGLITATAFVEEKTAKNVILTELIRISQVKWTLPLIEIHERAIKEKKNIMIIPFHKPDTYFKNNINEMLDILAENGYGYSTVEPLESEAESKAKINIVQETAIELIPHNYLSNSCMIFLLFDAQKKLDEYDSLRLDRWKEVNVRIQAVLFNAKVHHLERFLGEIPKNRSLVRTSIKNWIKRYSRS
jgi:hypothetical protein